MYVRTYVRMYLRLPFRLTETDYDSGPYQVRFNSEESSASALIRSRPDECAEQQENFTLNVQLSVELQNMNIHLGAQDEATVELRDPTGEVTGSTHSKLRIYSQIKVQFSNYNACRQELRMQTCVPYVMKSENYLCTYIACLYVSKVFALQMLGMLNSLLCGLVTNNFGLVTNNFGLVTNNLILHMHPQ